MIVSKGNPNLALAAVAGILAGLNGCAESVHAAVPGAPSVDPAGVPAARASEPPGAAPAKMSCGAMMKMKEPEQPKMSCGAMGGTKEQPKDDEGKKDKKKPESKPD